jgi:hypothetical protein
MLFGWMARAVIQRVGEEKGEVVVRQAVRRYGEQRGRRMALRAEANGHPRSMTNYIVYGEWAASEPVAEQKVLTKSPDARVQVLKCPWHRAWKAHDLMPYGRLYCMEVDEALVRGFNPDLRLDVNGTLSGGDDCCEFVFYGAKLNLLNTLGVAYKKAVKPGKTAVMPWEYHIGHLYKTVSEVATEELGDLGHEAAEEAMAAFAAAYGKDAAGRILAFRDMDFDQLPG